MSAQARFGPEAALELEEAVRWYEDRRAGLGLAFLSSVDDVVSAIARWPQIGTPTGGAEPHELRRAPLARFPYHVAYLVDGEQIIVIAVAHDRRRPKYWSGRLDQ